jgi:hypothetical protein
MKIFKSSIFKKKILPIMWYKKFGKTVSQKLANLLEFKQGGKKNSK